jgi:hypothetical protein
MWKGMWQHGALYELLCSPKEFNITFQSNMCYMDMGLINENKMETHYKSMQYLNLWF